MKFLTNYKNNNISDRAAFWFTFALAAISMGALFWYTVLISISGHISTIFVLPTDYLLMYGSSALIIIFAYVLGKISQSGSGNENSTEPS